MKKTAALVFIGMALSCGKPGKALNSDEKGSGRTPDNKLPYCSELCPKDERVLDGRAGKLSYLAFENFGWLGIGRCRGHAIVSQKMVELARFKEGSGQCETKRLSNECLGRARNAIEDVLNYKVGEVFGFKNLYSFSSHPEIKKILINAVKRVPHRYRATRGHIQDPSRKTEDLNIFYELKRRVLLNQTPYVAIYGHELGHHALLAYSFGSKEDRTVLCVRDPNIVANPSAGEICQNRLFHDESGVVFYKREGEAAQELLEFGLFSDEDERVERYIEAKRLFCEKKLKARGRCL